MRTFWLSFTDPDRPAGSRFLGVCVIDVTEAEATAARAAHPQAAPDAEWIGAAMRHAWAAGCNPGGQVGSIEITDAPEAARAPRDRLLSKSELAALGLA